MRTLSALLLPLILVACVEPAERSPSTPERLGPMKSEPSLAAPTIEADKPIDHPGVHNLVWYADGLYSGSVPEGEEGFETLRRMGVKTIISVDGAKPEVELAKKHGLRYVHLPIGYDGLDRERTLEISRAAKELPGPIYIHCHHGKHRSAGAAGATAVTLGYCTAEEALSRMKVSGTAANYTGLFESVTVARPASDTELKSVSGAFPSIYKTSGTVASMVEIDAALDHLKEIERASWRAPADHPDLVPAAEAGRLADLLRNLTEDDETRAKEPAFTEMLLGSSRSAASLEEALLSRMGADELGKRMKTLTASCKDCHTRYRD